MAPSALDLQLGALEIGLGICCFLVGIVTLQTLNYFRNFGRDPWTIKLLVATVYTFDLIHSAFLLHTLYVYSVTNFGNAERMEFSVWSLNTSIIFQGLVILLVQTIVSTDFKFYSFAVVEIRFQTFVAATLAITAINDVAIASCVVGSLLKQKTGFSSTNKLIDKIIGFVVGTGLLTSVLAVVDLITFVTMKNFIWLGILIIIVKGLYDHPLP
ncbi:hypothetical protein EXIGLDRAFT_759834 [Exidia glandulosa HHB12029]|uniref:DUF6534 domain-containing protein n=1 Tax=Exidia glandulosa HHB12029 TaxID=1314781 RepID=A0A165PVN8_EXIGL|nr:hypothetical protein EXIGLDRAFT_759834 [Exidia glandulosa HHB12029]